MKSKSIRLAMFPEPYTSNALYLIEIAREMDQLGCQIIQTPSFLSPLWLICNHNSFDVLHLHWPELYYGYFWTNNPQHRRYIMTWFFSKIGMEGFGDYLGLAWYFSFIAVVKLLNIPLVWTLHDLHGNANSSERVSRFETTIRRHLMRNVDTIILNCEGIQELAREKLGLCKQVVTAPLGGYRKFYTDTVSRAEARDYFKLPDDGKMLLFFGTQRASRNCLELLDVFRAMENKDLRLYIAGGSEMDIRENIEKKAWGDWRIRFYLQHVPDEQVEYFFKAADLVVMPSKNYLTSAVIALAMSYGVPVVAPDFGCAPSMVRDAGVLYRNGGTPEDLRQGIDAAIAHLPELTSIARNRMIQWGSWKYSAEQVVKAYTLAIENKRRKVRPYL
jgi:glycosyltransferase involved in cell wall biosynthesis